MSKLNQALSLEPVPVTGTGTCTILDNITQSTIPKSPKYKLDQHLIGYAANVICLLKNLTCPVIVFNAVTTHPYPILVYDAIRNVSCDLKSSDIVYENENIYKDFDEVYHDACLMDFLRSFTGRGVSTEKIRSFGVKPFHSLSPYVSKCNKSKNAPPLTTKNWTRWSVQRGDEVE